MYVWDIANGLARAHRGRTRINRRGVYECGGGTRHAHGLHWAKIARPALSNAGCVDLTYILLEGSIHTTRALAWAYLDSPPRVQGKEYAGARDTFTRGTYRYYYYYMSRVL